MPQSPLTVLVTGASAGIGAATARAFARRGDRVIVLARSEEKLADLVAEIEAAGGEALALPLDVSDAAAHAAAIEGLPEAWSAIDVFVANAGLARGLGPVWENTVDEIDAMVDTNVKGVLYGIRAVVPGMIARGRGHVVTLGSVAGHHVYPGGAVYCATKHALLALTLGLKMDLHGTPVRVSAVSPGLVETDFSLVRFSGDAERADAVYSDTHALAADDIADAVLYCVTAPAHVNVQEVLVTPRAQSGLAVVRGEAARGL
ncbi:MAG TPA: SDR family NAD(P)-dependent oxidoreductase [Rubricoccaceae bacterium]|jgi:NADP-dependent 3-hydroxy acid dehydrogenase YdfG